MWFRAARCTSRALTAETDVLLFEPSTTVNTGDTPSTLTAERHVV